jgi:hypothetical protein
MDRSADDQENHPDNHSQNSTHFVVDLLFGDLAGPQSQSNFCGFIHSPDGISRSSHFEPGPMRRGMAPNLTSKRRRIPIPLSAQIIQKLVLRTVLSFTT